ncbi:MAG: GNAT family protein [Rikenellaceae bacterium]
MRSINITSGNIGLRALEPEDLDLVYVWENDPSDWEHSATRIPYSRHQLRQFIESQSQDLRSSEGQIRLIVCCTKMETLRGENTIQCGDAIGMVDIFEYDHYNHRAGLGIYIDPAFRCRGYARQAILTTERYLFEKFRLHQLWCNILSSNLPSIELFKKCGYIQTGTKQEWHLCGEDYIDEFIFQKKLK